jgi:hypothetical protein
MQNSEGRMSIAAVRRLIGDSAKTLIDDQVKDKRDKLYEFAGVAIDLYQGFLERAVELDDYTMSLGGDTPFLHLMGWGLERLEELDEDSDAYVMAGDGDAAQDEEADSESQEDQA